ncbi:CoA-transferase [Actinacidiphila sp. bgisy145]|uniref:CoA-transferase n=1 Tax=Actinacidiphila sp. bgisy145 TaxID=3413792 RepID=UPI003EC0D0FE
MGRPLIAADPDALVREFVRPGDHVHLAGTPSRPNALTYALCRVLGGEGHLTVSTTAVHSSAHALALSGVADKVIAGFAGDTYPSPRPNPLYRDLFAGRPFAFEAWSLLSYQQRLIAGAQGLPYAVTASLAGTDLAADKDGVLHQVPDPADPDRAVTLLAPLRPDLTLLHGVLADEDGNIALVPPLGEGAWAAYAARRGVLASVERIVPREVLRALADRVVIPGQRVLGLCEAPLGAHPQSLRTGGLGGVQGYLDDYAFLTEIVESCHGEQRGADWYRTWVAEPGSHEGYLRRLGPSRRASLALPAREAADPTARGAAGGTDDFAVFEEVARAELAACRAAREPSTAAKAPSTPAPSPTAPPVSAPAGADPADGAEPTRQERLIVLGARAVADRVRAGGHDTLLAGIGASHMAAWLAAAQLRAGGHEVTVVAELGMCGFAPAEGDVFLFSLHHAEHSEMLAGIPEILGGMVAANPRALGVLAAAEIDGSGAINTSRTRDGRWLTGSGGANDIASTTDCVVIAPASPRRYVTALTYRTSPGDRVREVVSDFGRFRRDDPNEPFHLASWLPPASGEDADPQRMVAERTSWDSDASRAEAEKPVTPEELALLRTLDPAGVYR